MERLEGDGRDKRKAPFNFVRGETAALKRQNVRACGAVDRGAEVYEDNPRRERVHRKRVCEARRTEGASSKGRGVRGTRCADTSPEQGGTGTKIEEKRGGQPAEQRSDVTGDLVWRRTHKGVSSCN
ncbi:hypothetical protein ERJ75_001396100 [Trypanosoma vivax]|nr:hypothetical protein ERJ75_001792800 [Trypanosoma vivax]KAH8607603.1 hypothetical protein ERJ75_001396100 [Trypanosoma vivax]